MGFSFGDIFGDKRKTEQTSTQTGDSSYGLTPEIKKYWESISGMYGPDAWKNVDPNQYQQAALQAGAGYASGLNPLVTGATSIGQTGIDPNSIGRYYNAATDGMVQATQADFDRSNAQGRARDMAFAAKAGVPLLNSSQAGVTRQLGDYSREKAQAPVIAAQRADAWKAAAGLAGQDVNTRLAGYGAAGNFINAQGNLNDTSYRQGTQDYSQAFQNAMMPYQIAQQGAQTLGGLTQGSGQHTSGTATGTSTQTATPSPFSVGMGLAGLGMQMFSDERLKENIKPIGETYDGQPIYKYNMKGSPTTQIGLMAQDVEMHKPGAVGSVSGLKTVNYDAATKDAERERKADGGAVGGNDPHQRLAAAFEAVHGMLHKARGGSVLKPRLAEGGDVGMTGWQAGTTVTPAGSSFDFGKLGKGLSDLGKGGNKDQGGGGDGGLGQQQSALAGMLSSMSGARRGFADGGFAGEWGENGPIFDDKPGQVSGLGAPMFVGAGMSRSELPPPREPVSPSINPPVSRDDLIGAIKGFEGFEPKAAWDYKQNSVGYGTRATSPGEVITKEEADRRLADEVAAAGRHVDAFAPNLDPGTRSALTSLTYNAGTGWQKSGLGEAIKAGDMDTARKLFVQYNRAGGKENDGLTNRRNAEVAWIGAGSRVPNPITDPPDAYYPTDYKAPSQVASATGGVSLPTSSRGAISDAPSEKSWLQRILPGLSEGVFVGKEMTPAQRLGTMLMSVKSPTMNAPFEGVASNVMAQNQARMEERRIDADLARMLGELTGKDGKKIPTVEAKRLALEVAKNPAEIKALEARSVEGHKDTKQYDIEQQRMLEDYKIKLQKDLASQEALRKTESSIDNAVMSRFITQEEGEQRKQKARELYLQGRENIHGSSTPPVPQPKAAPGTDRVWVPGRGVQ